MPMCGKRELSGHGALPENNQSAPSSPDAGITPNRQSGKKKMVERHDSRPDPELLCASLSSESLCTTHEGSVWGELSLLRSQILCTQTMATNLE